MSQPLSAVIVRLEEVDVVAQRLIDNRATDELVGVLDSVASRLGKEEGSSERGA